MQYTREQLIDMYKNLLGPSWVNWGLEIVESADRALASKYFDSSKGDWERYVQTILFNRIRTTNSKGDKHLQLLENYDVADNKSSLVHIMQMDVRRDLGDEVYSLALDKFGYRMSVKAVAERHSMTVEAVRWQLKKFQQYADSWKGEPDD